MKRQLLTVCFLTLAAAAAQAETYTFRSGQNGYLDIMDDAYIRLTAGGAGVSNTTYGTLGNVYIRLNDTIHGLFRFDLTDLGKQAGTVTSAKLTLRDESTDKGTNYVTMYRLLKPWVEAQVTFNQYATGMAWETPGAAGATDRGPALATVDMPVSFEGTNGIVYDITIPTSLVQDWVDHPENNHGILLVASNGKTVNVMSSENVTLLKRPLLTVEAVPKVIETYTFRNGVEGYAGTDDTYIWSIGGKSNLNFGADANIIYLRASDHIHGLFRFDLSALHNKRVEKVVYADLTLFDNVAGTPTYLTADMRRLLKNWVENQVTYLDYSSGLPWQTPGALGAADSGPLLKTVALSVGTTTNFTFTLPEALVEDWIANPSSNHGFMLDPTGAPLAIIVPSENAAPHKRPKLTLKVLIAPPKGTLIGVK